LQAQSTTIGPGSKLIKSVSLNLIPLCEMLLVTTDSLKCV